MTHHVLNWWHSIDESFTKQMRYTDDKWFSQLFPISNQQEMGVYFYKVLNLCSSYYIQSVLFAFWIYICRLKSKRRYEIYIHPFSMLSLLKSWSWKNIKLNKSAHYCFLHNRLPSFLDKERHLNYLMVLTL